MGDTLIANSALFADIRNLIDATRHRSALALNAELVMTYWRIGQRIRQDILAVERAEYEQAIISTLSQQLSRDYGGGYSAKNLRRMVQFAAVFSDVRSGCSRREDLFAETPQSLFRPLYFKVA